MHPATPTAAPRARAAGGKPSYEALLARAKEAFRRSDWDACADAAHAAIAQQPGRADGHHLLGLARRQQGRMPEAQAAAAAALKLAPANAVVRRTAGMTAAIQAGRLHAEGRLEEALQASQAGLAIAQEVPELWGNHGVILQGLGRFEEAEAALRKATQLAPDEPDHWNNLGNVLHERQLLTESLQALEQAVRLDERNAGAWLNYGNVMLTMGREADAAQAYGLAAELDPALLQAPANMADLVRQQGQYVAASELFRAVLAQSDRQPMAWYGLGMAQEELGELDTAADCFERALALQPRLKDATLSLALLRCDQEAVAEADALVQRSLTAWPEHPRTWSTHAHLMKKRGDLAAASASVRKALELEWAGLRDRRDLELLASKARPPMKVEHAGLALILLKDLLDRLGVPFFLAYGTLLGIVRDGEMLPFDKDMDIGLPWDLDREWLMGQIDATTGFFVKNRERLTPEAAEWNFSVVHKATGILTDFFFFKPAGGKLVSGFHHLPLPLTWEFSAFDTAPLGYRGFEFAAPAQPERFLEEIYGPGWHQPDPYFDSVVTGRNLSPHCRELSMLFGLLRLHANLRDRAWKKAYGYCVQLLAYGADPAVEELAAWLQALVSPQPAHA